MTYLALFGQLINALYCLYKAIKEKDEPVWWVAFLVY